MYVLHVPVWHVWLTGIKRFCGASLRIFYDDVSVLFHRSLIYASYSRVSSLPLPLPQTHTHTKIRRWARKVEYWGEVWVRKRRVQEEEEEVEKRRDESEGDTEKKEREVTPLVLSHPPLAFASGLEQSAKRRWRDAKCRRRRRQRPGVKKNRCAHI